MLNIITAQKSQARILVERAANSLKAAYVPTTRISHRYLPKDLQIHSIMTGVHLMT